MNLVKPERVDQTLQLFPVPLLLRPVILIKTVITNGHDLTKEKEHIFKD
jgi:hypothetical protein